MSTGARDQILHGIRRALGRGPLDESAAAPLRDRLAAPSPNLVPKRTAGLDATALLAMFKSFIEEADTSVAVVPDAAAVPKAVTAYLAGHNLPAEAAMAPDAALDAYPWDTQPMLRLRRGPARESDAVGITPAFAAIAESGTLMLTSGADRPTTLNFLPGTHVVILRKDQLVGSYEQAWAKLRHSAAAHNNDKGGEAMPRAVNLISGPSRTGDIEQQLFLGAHGPVRLHIIVVER
jgi:L-lactate dehydrogenase complex protein LldG